MGATPDNMVIAEMQALTARDSFVMTSHLSNQTPQLPLARFTAHVSIAVFGDCSPSGSHFLDSEGEKTGFPFLKEARL
jgi:hypothetical protein